jgi:hypothetical protein
MTPKLQGLRELTDAELDLVTGGDKPNASGFVGESGKKNAQLSNNPNDGPGAYTPGNK